MGCAVYNYPPSYVTVRDSYNTYAPVYAPTTTRTEYAYTPPPTRNPANNTALMKLLQQHGILGKKTPKKVKKVKIYRNGELIQ